MPVTDTTITANDSHTYIDLVYTTDNSDVYNGPDTTEFYIGNSVTGTGEASQRAYMKILFPDTVANGYTIEKCLLKTSCRVHPDFYPDNTSVSFIARPITGAFDTSFVNGYTYPIEALGHDSGFTFDVAFVSAVTTEWGDLTWDITDIC